jgi:hypothetical protein
LTIAQPRAGTSDETAIAHPRACTSDETANAQPRASTSDETAIAQPRAGTSGETADAVTDDTFEDVDSDITPVTSISGRVRRFDFHINETDIDPIVALNNRSDEICSIILRSMHALHAIKWYLCIQVEFVRTTTDGIDETAEPHFNGQSRIQVNDIDIRSNFRSSLSKILKSFSEYQREGSAWILSRVLRISLNIVSYKPISGSTYIKLPISLARTKALINISNVDDLCFMYAVLAALHHSVEDSNSPVDYLKYTNELNFNGIDFPIKLCAIDRFERLNDISINVFAFDEEVFPLRITKKRNVKHINLLLLSNEETQHYCWIKNMSALLNKQRKMNHKRFYCDYCLHGFTRVDLLQKHIVVCKEFDCQRTTLPSEEDKWLYYKEHAKELRVPFVVYCDFECILERLSGCDNAPDLSSTDKISLHTPCGFAYNVIAYDDGLSEDIVRYRGKDAANVFLDHMDVLQERLCKILDDSKPMYMSPVEQLEFQNATKCHICKGDLLGDSVRDHDHLTGKLRGAAHNECNLKYKVAKFIPVVIHNLKKYDGHLILSAVNRKIKRFNCIPMNMENFMSFSIDRMRYIDSLQFLSASLTKLVDNLSDGDDLSKFSQTRKYIENKYPGSVEVKLKLLTRKGVYPYEYMSSFERFNERELPSKADFFSTLSSEDISVQDYEHAQKVWQVFNIKTIGEYHDLYVATDVNLLSDVFETFRNMCMEYYQLDPAHFYSLPGVSWTACLKMTQIKLELFTDIDQHLFVESGIRGGISMIVKRHSKANNHYLPDYDSAKPSNYIIYKDCNNLYGTSMKYALPTDDFKWLSEDDIDKLNIMQIPDNSPVGYILEVDLDYPEHLHKLHNDFPLAPERLTVKPEMLSDYQNELKTKLHWIESPKLINNLNAKKCYTIHYSNLKLYLSLGMVLRNIHRVLSFNQSDWMSEYIDFNTNKRREAKTDFEKDLFKLLVNSIYGKSLQNDRKHKDVSLVTDEKKLCRLTRKPGFKCFKIYNETLTAVQCAKNILKLNKPIYLGFCILELSKCIMFDFHYNHIKKIYGDSAELLFTDTDSLCYDIKTQDVYKDMAQYKHLYDFSNYPQTHELYSAVNKKRLGCFKDETASVPIEEFVGLRSKMYSLKYKNTEKKVAKGVSRAAIKHRLSHAMYKDSLFAQNTMRNEMQQFRSYCQRIYTVKMIKVTLSPFDDKRYILADGVHTLAYGHDTIE